MSKFKIGDKVKCIKDCYLLIKKGENAEVLGIRGTRMALKNIFGEDYLYDIEDFELVKEKNMKLSDLKERWLVEFRDGTTFIIDEIKGDILILTRIIKGKSHFSTSLRYNDDLSYHLKHLCAYDIVKIFKPKYEEIWTRKEETKEITMQDIEEKFGCKIKIIKK